MRKEVRRIIMFCTILTLGLLLLFIDVTLVQLLFLIVVIAIILPFLLGLVTIAEVRTAFVTFKEQRLRKISILKKLDEIKLFEKKGPAKPDVPVPKAKAPAKPAVPEPAPKKMPFGSQIESVVSTFRSLGSILKERTRRERKVSDINTMLDKTVGEKVGKAAAPAAGATTGAAAGGASLPAPGGAGSGPAAETDPFLSLSGDEFDAGLLDGLDEDMEVPAPAGGAMPAEAGASPDMGLPEPELSVPNPELDSAADDILKANAGEGGLDEFSGLESGGEEGTDFGDLENLSLDDVDLEGELGDEAGPGESPAAPEAASQPAAPAAGAETSPAVKTAWIPSDAPKGADQQEDQIGTQADMASFASASGGSDEDLLSSIASDVKHTTKEKDLSLLRELKDFKAPANEIEKELTDMYQKMSTVQKPKDKIPPATNGIK